MKRALLYWLAFAAVAMTLGLIYGVIANDARFKTPWVAIAQILFDATSVGALTYRLYHRRDPKEVELLGFLLAAFVSSLAFTITYQGFATFLGQEDKYPTWTVYFWIMYLVFMTAFWVRTLQHQVAGLWEHKATLARVALFVAVSLVVAHGLHLSDLFLNDHVEGFRRGVYGLSGVVEGVAAIAYLVASMMYRRFSWIQILCLSQLGLVQLDLVFCTIEFNNKTPDFVSWPFEAAWASCQWAAAWIVVSRLGDLRPFLGQVELSPPRHVFRGPVAWVMLVAALLLGALTFYVTSVSSWQGTPLLRGEGVALSVLVFTLFVVFVVPHLVFDDGPEVRAPATAAIDKVITVIGDVFVHKGDIVKGDKILNQGGVVATGGSQVNGVSINSSVWHGADDPVKVRALAEDLARLIVQLKTESSTPSHYKELGAIAEAEQAAKEGNGPKAVSLLKATGKWALEIAEKIGVAVAASAIKSALGMA